MAAGSSDIQTLYSIGRILPAWTFSVFLTTAIVLILVLLVKATRSSEGIVKLWPPEFSWGGETGAGRQHVPETDAETHGGKDRGGDCLPNESASFMAESASCLAACVFRPPPDPSGIPKAVLGLLLRTLSDRQVNRVVVLLPDKGEGGKLREVLVEGSMDSPFLTPLHDDGSPAGEAMRLNEAIISRDTMEDALCRGRIRHRSRCRSIICLPLGNDERADAVLQAESIEGKAFSKKDVSLFESMSSMVAVGLKLAGMI